MEMQGHPLHSQSRTTSSSDSPYNPFLASEMPQHSQHQQQNTGYDEPYPTRPVDLAYTETIVLDEENGNGPGGRRHPVSGDVDLVQEILTNRDLLISKGFYFFFYAAFGSLFPLMGIYFKQMGMNSVQAGILTGVRPFIEIFSAPFWGSVADRFNKGKILLLGSMVSWIVFTCAMAYIRPPAAACVTFNETHHVLYTPYSDESDEDFEMSVTPQRRYRRSSGSLFDLPSQLSFPVTSLPSMITTGLSDYKTGFSLHETSDRVKRELAGRRNNANRHKPPPTHIIGKSPIPIDYTLNFNKDIHASYVSPPFSTVVYKWEDVESVFLLLMLLVLIGEFFSAPAITLADSVTLEYLGDNIDNYGRQRMFGSVGWAISMFFVGMALDNSTEFTKHPCGPHESERNYKVCFSIFAVLMMLATGLAWQFRFPDRPNPNGPEANSVPMKAYDVPGPKPIFNTAPPINPPPGMGDSRKFEFLDKWKSAVFAQRTREMPEWVEVLKTFANLRYGAFLFVTWFMGAGIGMVFAFLFWHLQDLGGTPTLFGLASVINHISEIAAYFYSLEYIKKYGHTKVLCFGLVCNLGRFLYIAWLDNPWFVLPFELLQGVTHAGVWAACCSYITQATPPHLKASTQGVLQGLHHGFGRGAGAILAGIFINKFGTRPTFACYGLLCGLVLAFFIFVNSQRTEAGFRWFEDETEHQVYIEEASGLAPHGVPSAPITRTASKVNLTTGPNQGLGQQAQPAPETNPYLSSDGTALTPNYNRWNLTDVNKSETPLSFSSLTVDYADHNDLGQLKYETVVPIFNTKVADLLSPSEPISDHLIIRNGFRDLDQVLAHYDDLSTYKSDLDQGHKLNSVKVNISAQQPPNYLQSYDW